MRLILTWYNHVTKNVLYRLLRKNVVTSKYQPSHWKYKWDLCPRSLANF